MEPFTHYKLNETAEGIEVILYLNESLTEFANELGSPTNADQSNIKQDARSFVKQKFPKLKIKSIKIMAGAMVLTTLGLGTLPTLQASAAETTTAQSQKTTSSYTVLPGDTLYSIAKRYDTTVDTIKKANGLSSNHLQIGQALTIPSSVTLAPSESQVTPSEQKSEVNQEDVEWLAKMIYSEGRGESLEGQIAIGAVIMNRVESPLFPNTVKDVLLEKSYGYYQFTPAATGAIYKAVPHEENIEAAKRAINGEDPTNGALFFYNPDKTSSTYLKSRTVSTVIGNHTFAF